MWDKKLAQILDSFRKGLLNIEEATEQIKGFLSLQLDVAEIDLLREARTGFPEIIYCAHKTDQDMIKIVNKLIGKQEIILLTRARKSTYELLSKKAIISPINYYEKSGIIIIGRLKEGSGRIAVVTGGTSDIPVAEEAALTAQVMGAHVDCFYDIGVAGLHRLLSKIKTLRACRAIVAVAGMDGALPTVLAGLVKCPVIAVPTSVGYGANFNGIAPLLTMLNSCAPGVAVVNIDNGFGAGYLAALINKLGENLAGF